MSPPLRVLVADERGRPAAAPGLARWLARVAPSRVHGTVNIAIISDARIRGLNRRYRAVDHATDVLSFPVETRPRTQRSGKAQRHTRGAAAATPSASSALSPQPPAPSPLLGDIVIARGVARRQAREAHHSEGTELRVLALHGLLHLIGYDHERDDGSMRRVEHRLRRKGRLREGLMERAGRAALKAGESNERRRGRRARNR